MHRSTSASARILIDASHWGVEQPTGVEHYVDNLLPELLKALPKAGMTKICFLSYHKEPPVALPEGVEWYFVPYQPGWGQLIVPHWANKLNAGLYFTPSGLPPGHMEVPTAFTIHDMSVFRSPGSYPLIDQFRLKVVKKARARRAAAICVPSEFTRAEILAHWNVAPEKITVTPLALPPRPEVSERPRFAPKNKYFFSVGRIEHKKNLEVVIRAFAALNNPALDLVLAGGDGFGAEQVRQTVERLPEAIRMRVHLPGYVTPAEKRWLLEHAHAVVAPCPYEGFGLAALEAFSVGVPLLVADAGALPEVAGDAGLRLLPDSLAAWRDGMEQITKDRSLRAQLAALGTERIRRYTWKRTATKTAAALAGAITS